MCRVTKGDSEFYWRKGGNIHSYTCKKCYLTQCKEYSQTDKGKASKKKASTKYSKTDKGRATSAKYTKTDKGKATHTKHRKTDKCKVSMAKHKKTDKFKETRAEYDKSDEGKATKKKATEKYNKTAKGKANSVRARATRRAKEKDIINTLTGEQWNQILKEQGHKCKGCKTPFSKKPATADHIKPLSKGGGTTKENIQALCFSCNAIKGNRTMKFLIQQLEKYDGFYPEGEQD